MRSATASTGTVLPVLMRQDKGEAMSTTKLRVHPLGSQFNDGRGVTVNRSSVRHIQWLYRCMRSEGHNRADARMNLVHAFAAGQRDVRKTVEDAVRSVG